MSEDNFFERVYAVARQIPFGMTSYGAIAKQLVRADQHEWWAMP
jgi:methylated-DNA-protein-cysteine methyltransferase-like protein